MNLRTVEFETVRNNWARMTYIAEDHNLRDLHMSTLFSAVSKKNEVVEISDWYCVWVNPDVGVNQVALKIKKDYWAKGRNIKFNSKIPGVPSGDYKIIYKAQSNSYDKEDFLIAEFIAPEFTSPKKALNWLEKQLEELEARDGITTDTIVKEMKVRG